MSHTVLVTGATGFLGGTLAVQLAADGHHVRAIGRSTQHKGAYLRAHNDHGRITLLKGDILHSSQVDRAIEGCDLVIHAAAALGGTFAYQRRTNVDGTRTVMQAAAEASVQRVVHISTIAVYGYGHTQDVTEDTPPRPSSDPYAVTKREAESVVRTLGTERSVPYTIIRPGAIYGPRSRFWTGRFFRMAQRPPVIFVGDGRGSAPLIFVDDVVDLCRVAAAHPAAAGEAFNATADPAPTWREYLLSYARVAGHARWLGIPVWLLAPMARLRAAVAPEYSRARVYPELLRFATHPITYRMTKAREQLDWCPPTDLPTGVARSVDWLRAEGLLG